MKANKFHDMTTQELNAQVDQLKNELFNLRFQAATGQLQNPMSIRECRHNIARVKTILRERELNAKA